jgi:serine/threonine-protein kinase RsbW
MQPTPEPDRDLRVPMLHRVFPADPTAVRESLAEMRALPPLSVLTEDDLATVELVLAEALNNVVEHAYAKHAGMIEMSLTQGPRGLACTIVDSGLVMPDGKLPFGHLPDTDARSLDDLPEGGFGWHLIRSLTIDLSYHREAGWNRLSFTVPVAL